MCFKQSGMTQDLTLWPGVSTRLLTVFHLNIIVIEWSLSQFSQTKDIKVAGLSSNMTLHDPWIA